jgi:hypothetical protein
LSLEYKPIFDDVKSISLKSNHICDPQKLSAARLVTDIQGTISKLRQELILHLSYVVNLVITKNQERADLIAVHAPARIFDNRLDSYEYLYHQVLPTGYMMQQ